MELELCLSISKNGPTSPNFPNMKELDLLSYVNCKGKQVYYNNNYYENNDDDNCSTLSCQSSSVNNNDSEEEGVINEVEENCGVNLPKTLTLLHWDKHPNEDDHQLPKRLCNSTSFIMNINEGGSLVGWPPIKSNRKMLTDGQHYQHHHNYHQHHRRGGNFPGIDNRGHGGGCGGSRFMFVKVQMEGFFITRKVDLKLYHSYESLLSNLLTMFGKGQDNMDDYELTYQDRDGDWLLAGDVPWRTFMESVQRLKLRKRDD